MMQFRFLLVALFLLALTGCWKNDVGRSYYSSGKVLTEATIRNGVLDGPSTMYYESGARMSEAVYKSGLLSGTSISFYEAGQKKAQADYRDGLLHGWSMNWSEGGTLQSKACFSAGRLVFENVKLDSVKECIRE